MSRALTPERVDEPKLSIVIPAYNVADYIITAIESALQQTVREIEVIVIDDGSVDVTPALIADYVQRRRDPRLRVIRQCNAGLSAARNAGITLARAPLIGFLDGDDLWLPEKAQHHLAAFAADPGLGLSFSHSAYLTEAGAPTNTVLYARAHKPTLHAMIRRNHVGNGSAPVVRRICFDQAGRFRTDLRSCEDYEMWCRLLSRTAYTAALVPRILTLYRLRSSSLSFDSEVFLENAARAVGHIEAEMPAIPAALLRGALAEHHRIAAWKAVSVQRSELGLRLLARAIKLSPSILLTDWRVAGTAIGAALPLDWRNRLVRVVKSIQRRSIVRRIHRRAPDLLRLNTKA